VTASPADRADSGAPVTERDAHRPAMFTTAIVLLAVSLTAFGLANGSSFNHEPATTASATTPIWWILYLVFVIRVARARRSARTVVTVLAVVNCVLTLGLVYGPEGVTYYAIGLATCVAGIVLLYLPSSTAYLAMRRAGPSATDTERQVRRLFDQRGRDGKPKHTVSDIATRLGISRSAVYRHLDEDRQRQVRQRDDGR
jgi:Bacterial regulatory protein, arsR family